MVAERGPADHRGGDRGQDDGGERFDGEVGQDQLQGEEHPGDRGVEGGRDAAGGAAGDQQPQPRLGQPDHWPRLEPSAEPICTIGPSRPTEPPPPMHTALARALTAATRGRIRPPCSATAYITSGTPWPRASRAKKCTSGP